MTMKKFEVQTLMFWRGWVNTWLTIDRNGVPEPVTFESYATAEAALDEFFAEVEGEIALGLREPDAGYSRDTFRIVETYYQKKGA